MKTYLVRAAGDEPLFLIVVVAHSLKGLFWGIDEFTDPFSCEFYEVTDSGALLYVGLSILPPVPDDVEYDLKDPDLPENTLDALDSRSSSEWKQFPKGFRSI